MSTIHAPKHFQPSTRGISQPCAEKSSAPSAGQPAEVKDQVTLGGQDPSPLFYTPYKNGSSTFQKSHKVEGVYSDTVRREVSSEQKVLGTNVKTTAYQESNSKAYGRGSFTAGPKGSADFDAGVGASQEDKIGVRTDVRVSENVSVSNQNELSKKTEARSNVSVITREEQGDYARSVKLDVQASDEVKSTSSQELMLGKDAKDPNRITFSNVNETKVAGDAHAQGEDTLIVKSNKLYYKKDVDLSLEAQAGNKNTWKMETGNGSSFETSSEVSVSEGFSAKGGVTFGRDNDQGTTELGIKVGGPLPFAPMVGVGKEYRVKIADKDIDRVIDATNPLLPESVKSGMKQVSKGLLNSIPVAASAVTDKYLAIKDQVAHADPNGIRAVMSYLPS